MILTEQMMEAVVIDVLWNLSKDGYLIPKVRFEPVEIGEISELNMQPHFMRILSWKTALVLEQEWNQFALVM